MPSLVKRVLVVLGGLVLLAGVGVGALYAVGSSKWARAWEVETAELVLPTDPAEIVRGEHLAAINGCMDCHGTDLSGQVFADDAPFRLVASNLTAGEGGIGGAWSPRDLDRAIRHGVRPDGTALFIMPSAGYHNMSDADAAALIAWLRTVPPVDHELPPTEIRPLGRILGGVVMDPSMEVRTERPPRATAPPRGPTLAYGEYLAGITCAYCHGADLTGAREKVPGSPPPPDIVATARAWTLEEWTSALRTGVRPDGSEMVVEYMPWTLTAAMGDDELEALYLYLKGV